MANTFNLTGTLKDSENNPIYVGKYVLFRVTAVGADAETGFTYPRSTRSLLVGSSGDISGELWVNGNSGISTTYEITFPDGEKAEVVLPDTIADGATVDLQFILNNYQTAAGGTQSIVLDDAKAYIDVFASSPTANASFSASAWWSGLSSDPNSSVTIKNLTLTTPLPVTSGGTGAASASAARTNLGLGTISTQSAASVAITGGTVTGITDLALADGGTGASTAADARTNLGLGTISTQAASGVTITGGSITGITDLLVADGGTGASDAATARTNLGIGSIGTQSAASVAITGGSIIGITDLAVADGGTGASDAATARTNLGIGTAATQNASNVAITGGSITGITDLAVADGGTGASDAATARANLGVGTLGAQNASSVAITGGSIAGITDLAVVDGGTGASSASGARTNLGLAIGTDVQAQSTTLAAIDLIGDPTADGEFLVATGAGSFAYESGATARTSLGLPANSGASTTSVITTTYTALTTDRVILASNASGVTITLMPAATAGDGFELSIKNVGSTGSVTIDAAGTETIDGTLTSVIVPQNDSLVLVSDGSNWRIKSSYIQDVDNEILVRRPEDFGTIDSSKVYIIDGDVDMGATSIVVPSTGIQIKGLGVVVSKLRSTQSAYNMFTDAANDAGDVFITGVDFIVSGAGSKVFDLTDADGSHTFELQDVNFTGCTKIGLLTHYRQFLLQRSFIFNCTGGWEFAGAWAGGARISTCLVRNFTGTLFKGITGMTFGSRFLSDANINIPSGSVGYDFQDASMFVNDADYELISGTLSGAGTLTSGLDHTSVKSLWRSNNGIENTYVGGQWELTAEAATAVASAGVFYKVAGTTTYSDEQWFSNTTDNALVYDSTRSVNVIIQGTIGVSGTNGHNIQFKLRKYDASAVDYVDIKTLPAIELAGTNAAASISVLAYATIDSINDRIELWGQNVGSASNFTVKQYSILSVAERT